MARRDTFTECFCYFSKDIFCMEASEFGHMFLHFGMKQWKTDNKEVPRDRPASGSSGPVVGIILCISIVQV